jgi:RNA polymerase sigma factor (sigma-70 family)
VTRAGDLNREPSRGVFQEGASPEEAFEQFLDDRYGRVVNTVRVIVGNTATAEDITQEAFARAYLSWAKLWPDGNPAGWVHRVATNLALSWRRRAAREVRALQRVFKRSQLSTPAPEVYPELHAAVASLPPRQRAAVALYYVMDLSVDEVAETMGCPSGTVKSLLYGARERLRTQLGEDYR